MPQFLSPDVIITENDNTGTTQGVSTAQGGYAGVFRWGPIGQLALVTSEADLVSKFGKPTNFNGESFFSAANFLAYSKSLLVSRAANTSANLVSMTFPVSGNVAAISDVNMIVTASSNVVTSNGVNLASSLAFSANVGDYVLFQQLQKSNTAVIVASNFRQVTSANSSQLGLDQPLTFTNANTSTNVVVAKKFAGAVSAFANTGVVDTPTAQIVKNSDAYSLVAPSFNATVNYVAKFPGNLGNSLRISVCDNASQYSSNIALTNCYFTTGALNGNLQFSDATAANAAWQRLSVGDYLGVGNSSVGIQNIQITNTGAQPAGNTITVTLANKYSQVNDFTGATTINRQWEFNRNTNLAPGQSAFVAASGNTSANDELHVVVVDQDGLFSGTPGTILEVYQNLSRATDAKADNNLSSYYANVLNQNSKYVWFANDRAGAASAPAASIASSTAVNPLSLSFVAGNDGNDEATIDIGSAAAAWDLFQNKESVDVDLIIAGKARGGAQLANYIADNIVLPRIDCVVFVSPDIASVVNNPGNELNSVVAFSNALDFNSYVVMDSGYKYQYDEYNDVYRYVPLNGDVAGAHALKDATNNVWDSAGNTPIKNCIKLAWNPKKAERDILYPNAVNPVVTFPGEGTVLFGDKTHLTRGTAFNRINTRRTFIFMEKTVAPVARSVLFKNNTPQTRRNFVASISPFFQNIKSKNGISDFKIVADETNNTDAVVTANQFVCDIFVQPVYSINWVIVNFNATKPGVAITETAS